MRSGEKIKKIVQINTVCNTSTGKLMGDIQREANASGYETLSIVGRRKPFSDLQCIKIGNNLSFWIHVGVNTLFDRQGYASYFVTQRIIRKLRQENPDIIHLHNLHGYYINLPLLFGYLSKEYNGKIFWTFHDCWPFTGHCAYFTAAGCGKWEKGCDKCPNKRVYPISLFADASKRNYMDKKRMFAGLKNLTIIVPSKWMESMVKKSFFYNYPVIMVNNGIDLKTFSYHESVDALYEKYDVSREKKVILGVANIWDARKGLLDFLALAKELPGEFQILLVGVSSRQIKMLPPNVKGIRRTKDIKELVMLYSLADIFINPSMEESFSLVTVEAIACGTPVVVLDTSAVKELVCDENGIILRKHDVIDYLDAIKTLEERRLSREQISRTAKKYDVHKYAKKVVSLYSSL